MRSNEEEHIKFVTRAFKILKLELPKDKKLSKMLGTLRKAANGPVMSKSEISVHDQIRELIKAIELKKTQKKLEEILEKLADEFNYSYFWD